MARHERPDLIVCDVNSSKLDGYNIVKEIRSHEELRHIPVVAAAMTMTGKLEQISAAGFNGCVGKPIASETFVEDLKEFLPPEQRAKAAREGR